MNSEVGSLFFLFFFIFDFNFFSQFHHHIFNGFSGCQLGHVGPTPYDLILNQG